MDVNKDFLQNVRKLTMRDVYIEIIEDMIPQLAEFVLSLDQVKLNDGSYDTYYGEVKTYIIGFLNFYNVTIDILVQAADIYSNSLTREELVVLMQKTIDTNYNRQIYFSKKFLPVSNAVERESYEITEKLFEYYKDGLIQFQNKIEKLQKQEKINEFAKDHFLISVKKTCELFDYTHHFISVMMTKRIKEIRISLEEILLRIENNLKTVREEYLCITNNLLMELYIRNKEYLKISRRLRKSSIEAAEVCHSMDILREKISDYRYDNTINRIEGELNYWKNRLKEFNLITDNLARLKSEQNMISKEEKAFITSASKSGHASQYCCRPPCIAFTYNMAKKQTFIREEIAVAARSLITFFSIKGVDQVMYKDEVGLYYFEEFNHKTYVLEHGSKLFHLTCEGQFKKVPELNKYYFDLNGRYIVNEDGEKNYQSASCSSAYKLGKEDLLEKVTEDCPAQNKNPNNIIILPAVKPIDIKETLDSETVEYLWNNFGHILPNALGDVGTERPNNPIHYLAHKILMHKYNQPLSNLWKNKQESEIYRFNILKNQKAKAVATSKAWKAKQIKRSKPEVDDDEDKAAYGINDEELRRIASLNYNDDQ